MILTVSTFIYLLVTFYKIDDKSKDMIKKKYLPPKCSRVEVKAAENVNTQVKNNSSKLYLKVHYVVFLFNQKRKNQANTLNSAA